jgi:hypothetical protein
MWGGYGGNGNGAAIVFDTAKIAAREESPLVIAHVHYGTAQDTQLFPFDGGSSAAELASFLRGGHQCVKLMTLSDLNLASAIASVCMEARQMSPEEAVPMITGDLPLTEPDRASVVRLAQRLGFMPLALRLAGITLRKRIERGEAIASALGYLHLAVDQDGVAAFDEEAGTEQTVTAALRMCLKALLPGERKRFDQLASFPAETEIPFSQISLLWNTRELETQKLIERFNALALVRSDFGKKMVWLPMFSRAHLSRRPAPGAPAVTLITHRDVHSEALSRRAFGRTGFALSG